MPKKKEQLAAEDIAAIATWIDAGAPYDRPLVAQAREVKPKGTVTEADRQFWSFRPLVESKLPTVRRAEWVQSPVDRFILAKLEEKSLPPNDSLQRRQLIRRAYFDVIGLPPTPEEIDAFVSDSTPDAYERVVDRLLSSPHYGERWGRHWLDVARFAESHGHERDYDRPFAYHFRDYVIRALNEDQPFDEFVRWQIAGDELAPDNPQAWFATGFLAAGTHPTQITANQAEKERYDALDDKIATIGTAMLGVTIGCARCHDHKYDPIPTRDYYRLLSAFTTTVRSDHYVDLNPAQTRAALEAWGVRHEQLQESLAVFEKEELPERLDAWLRTDPVLPDPSWRWLKLKNPTTGPFYGITKFVPQPEGSVLATIVTGSPEKLSFNATVACESVAAIRIEALADDTLPELGPGWGKDGGFSLADLTVTVKPAGDGEPQKLNFVRRTTTDGTASTTEILPWAANARKGRDQAAVFELEHPVRIQGTADFSFLLKFPTDFDRNFIGRIRVSLATRLDAPVGDAAVPADDFERVQQTLARPRRDWKPDDLQTVRAIYQRQDVEWLKREAEIVAHREAKPRPERVKALVCSEGLPALRLHTQGPDFYDETYILRRGDLAQKEEVATPGFLQVLMRTPEQEKNWQIAPPEHSRTPYRRAALARWITDVDRGAGNLLARVIVNRLWQHHFGRGIVGTPSDFGHMGDRPTHPELLDWLAGDLIKNGWRLKHTHRQILTSAAYRQDGRIDEVRKRADPENSLWWHRAPLRLEAEIIRDAMLAVSGRLDRKMFGPGSLDETMRRRSIYFFAKRSQLPPSLVQFDAPDTLQSVGVRVNTTVAPQALLLLNNTQVRACAHDFAERLRPAIEQSRAAGIAMAFRRALGREPVGTERENSENFLETQRSTYAAAEADQAPWVDLCHVLLLLNEFIYLE